MSRLVDKKIVWCVILMTLLCAFTLVFHIMDRGRVCNVKLESEERLLQICAGKDYIAHADNAKDLLLFENQAIPYDEASNSFYICQDIRQKEYRGTITAASENIAIWMLEDDYAYEFAEALRQSHSFSVWIATQDSYTICKIVFTGLPVVVLDTQEKAGMQYIQGAIHVWNPMDEEIGTISCKKGDAEIKCSQSMETYTVKFMNKEGNEHRKLSVLDMGKYDAWKLYEVSKQDMTYIRSMLAYLVWNRINVGERLDRPCRYAEVIINGEYSGLYLLAPRIDENYLDLEENGKVVSIDMRRDGTGESATTGATENTGAKRVVAPENNVGNIYEAEAFRFDNLVEYFLFLEMTYAFENVANDFYVAWDEEQGQTFLLPGKIEYSFGIFPNRLQYMTWRAQERMLTPELVDLAAKEGVAEDGDLEQRMGERYRELRKETISDDALFKLVDELQAYLCESGYIARSGANKDGENHYEEKIGELIRYLTERMEVLDKYYGTEG